jgi:hypothetical protein
MKTKLFLVGLALTAMVAVSSAQVGAGHGHGAGQGICTEECEDFVDNNNDGICDNYEYGTHAERNGLRRGLVRNGANATARGIGQSFLRGQVTGSGLAYMNNQGRGPASEGKHLYGPGNRVTSE